jgi:NAD(P)-dependent dehydrogenase (short-subunit alcohol dehydrogenase family)
VPQAVEEITTAGGFPEAEYLHHDVTREEAWIDVIDTIRDRHGRLDVLVNNAGIGIAASIVEMSLEDWQRQQAINLDGVFLGIKHAYSADARLRRRLDHQHVVGGGAQGQPAWPPTTPPRAACGCSPRAWPWSAPRNAGTSA